MPLFWSAPGNPANTDTSLLNTNQPPVRARAVELTPGDIVYPAPGGGLLRVPVGGGAAAQFSGNANGQLTWWDASAGQWVRSAAGPANGQTVVWNTATNAWEFVALPSPGALQYLTNEPGLDYLDFDVLPVDREWIREPKVVMLWNVSDKVWEILREIPSVYVYNR